MDGAHAVVFRLGNMSTLDEIEKALQQLPHEELAAFRAWFAEFDAAAWDRQLVRDESEARLDELAPEALTDVAAGRSTEL